MQKNIQKSVHVGSAGYLDMYLENPVKITLFDIPATNHFIIK